MEGLRRGRVGWAVLAAVLLLAATTSAVALTRSAGAGDGSSSIAAAGVGEPDSDPVVPMTTTTTTTAPTTAPTTSTTAAVRPSTTTSTRARPTTTVTAPVRTSTTVVATTTTTVAVGSWSAQDNGVSVRIRIDPPAPRAGQTVRFLLDASTDTGDFCCIFRLSVNDVLVDPFDSGVIAPGCPPPATAHEEHTIAVPAGTLLRFVVWADRMTSCKPLPPSIMGVQAFGSVSIAP